MISKLKSLKNHQGFVKYFKNTAWLFAEKILRMVIGLFVGIWVARYLGPEQFGLFSYAQSFVGLFVVVANLSMEGILVKDLTNFKENYNLYLGSAFVLRIIIAIITIFILWLSLLFTSSDSFTKYIILIISSSMIFQSFNIIDMYFQSIVMSKYVVFANFIVLLLSTIIKVILILKEAPLIAFVWVIVFDNIVLALGFIYFYSNKNGSLLNWSYDIKVMKDLLKKCLPLLPTAFVILAYMKVDQIMLGELLNKESVGYYAAALKLIEPLYIVPLVLINSFYPKLIETKSSNEKLYYSRIGNLMLLVYIFSLLVVCLYCLFSNEIITLLYGDLYAVSSNILAVSSFVLIFISMRFIIGRWFLIENLIKVYFVTSLAGLILNIVFNYYFIQLFGVIGASYATLLSFIIATFFIYLFSSYTRKIFILQIKVMILNLGRKF